MTHRNRPYCESSAKTDSAQPSDRGVSDVLRLGFVAIRGLGQGALGLVSINAINLWFVRRRGLALSLSGIGFAVGIGAFPLLIERLITIAIVTLVRTSRNPMNVQTFERS